MVNEKIKEIILLLVIVGIASMFYLYRTGYFAGKFIEPSPAYFPLSNVTEGPIISFNFDDGFSSVFDVGMPILDKAGFISSHYIVINRIGESGYMNIDQIIDIQKRGHEIGAHSRTHNILTAMSEDDAYDEISGSKKDLLKEGIARVDTFVYPDGYFNDEIVSLVKKAGYLGARITNPGLNDSASDPYRLLYLGMNSEITFEKVKEKIDQTLLEKKWLIMVFHRIGETGFENVSADLLEQTVNYVREKNVPVVTNAQGLFILKNIP